MESGLIVVEGVWSMKSMMLRNDGLQERIRFSCEFRSDHVLQVKAEMAQCGSLSALDLEEVDLVDVEAIHFLNSCEARGVSGLNASAYIRAWMVQERKRPAQQQLSEEKQGQANNEIRHERK